MADPVIDSIVAVVDNAETTTFILNQPNSVRVYLSNFDKDSKADVILEPQDNHVWNSTEFTDRTVEPVAGNQRISFTSTPSGAAGSGVLRVIVIGSELVPEPANFTITYAIEAQGKAYAR